MVQSDRLTKYMAVKTASMVAKSAFADWN